MSLTQPSMWMSALVMFLQCCLTSLKELFAFCPLLSHSLISSFPVFTSLSLCLFHLHTKCQFVSFNIFWICPPFLVYLRFCLQFPWRGTYSCCSFIFWSSKTPALATGFIFPKAMKSLGNSLLIWDKTGMLKVQRCCFHAWSLPVLLHVGASFSLPSAGGSVLKPCPEIISSFGKRLSPGCGGVWEVFWEISGKPSETVSDFFSVCNPLLLAEPYLGIWIFIYLS